MNYSCFLAFSGLGSLLSSWCFLTPSNYTHDYFFVLKLPPTTHTPPNDTNFLKGLVSWNMNVQVQMESLWMH